MEFEYDRSKSDSNREKHGIDFVEAQILWDDPKHIIAPAFSITEERFAINEDSTITVPSAPGLGMTINNEALERFTINKYET